MCGIFGWNQFTGEDSKTRLDIFKSLAWKAQFRGSDSFGLMYIKPDGKHKIITYLGSFTEWYQDNHKLVKNEIIKSPVVLGHTRMPSKGSVCLPNCHPFQVGDWVCMHNGTISNIKELSKKMFHYIPFGETDSEAMFCYLVENGITVENIEKLSGNYAFAMYNTITKQLILCGDSNHACSFINIDGEKKGSLIFHSTTEALQPFAEILSKENIWFLKEQLMLNNGDNVELQLFKEKSYTRSLVATGDWVDGKWASSKDIATNYHAEEGKIIDAEYVQKQLDIQEQERLFWKGRGDRHMED